MIYSLGDKIPSIHASCFIAGSADLIGKVILKENASVWFNCVIRADNEPISIGKNSNVQDGAVLHVDPGFALSVGEHVTVGHKAMLHGCTIGNNSLIGINAVVLNGAKIGEGCVIGANALITEGTIIPDGSLVMGSPGKIVKQLDENTLEMFKQGALHYVSNNQRYREALTPYAREQYQ